MIPFALCLLAGSITTALAFVVGHSLGFNIGHDAGWDACEEYFNADDLADIQWSCAPPPPPVMPPADI